MSYAFLLLRLRRIKVSVFLFHKVCTFTSKCTQMGLADALAWSFVSSCFSFVFIFLPILEKYCYSLYWKQYKKFTPYLFFPHRCDAVKAQSVSSDYTQWSCKGESRPGRPERIDDILIKVTQQRSMQQRLQKTEFRGDRQFAASPDGPCRLPTMRKMEEVVMQSKVAELVDKKNKLLFSYHVCSAPSTEPHFSHVAWTRAWWSSLVSAPREK